MSLNEEEKIRLIKHLEQEYSECMAQMGMKYFVIGLGLGTAGAVLAKKGISGFAFAAAGAGIGQVADFLERKSACESSLEAIASLKAELDIQNQV